jgi:hypothetical protein
MSAEVIAILRRALDEPNAEGRRAAAIDRVLRFQRNHRVPQGLPLAEDLVREDRDAR